MSEQDGRCCAPVLTRLLQGHDKIMSMWKAIPSHSWRRNHELRITTIGSVEVISSHVRAPRRVGITLSEHGILNVPDRGPLGCSRAISCARRAKKSAAPS